MENENTTQDQARKEARYLHEALGISDERNLELHQLCLSAVDKLQESKGFLIESDVIKAFAEIPIKNNIESVYLGFRARAAFEVMNSHSLP